MSVCVALPKGVNVGARSKVDTRELKAQFESLGCVDVRTYINSGNVVCRDRLALRKDLAPRYTVDRNGADATVRNVNTVRKLTALVRSR